MRNQKIAIAGVGFVGQAVKHWLLSIGVKPILYDPPKGIGNQTELNKAKIIFVCASTPYLCPTGYDDSAVVDILSKLESPKTVIIKSTVLPGSTEKWQQEFPGLTLFFNPEFLVQKHAKTDFLNPTRQIVGYTKKSATKGRKLLDFLPAAPYMATMSATDAEMVKYCGNLFLATKVMFANQIYDVAQALGADYEKIIQAVGADPRIGSSHTQIWHDGYRGYGGACLPKDTKAFLDFAKKNMVDIPLIKIVDRLNNTLTRSTGKRVGKSSQRS